MRKKVAILGSTGSIGKSALKIIQHLPLDLEVSVLAAKSSSDLLEQQARFFKPKLIALWDKEKAFELQRKLPSIPVLGGEEGIIAAATEPTSDLLLCAIFGFEGILPTLKAIEAKKRIALACKEVLVAGGEIIMAACKAQGVELIPVDSEHTALFQCLKGESQKNVRRIILTASGGPFRNYTQEMLSQVEVSTALTHPNYTMGPKVTIDSSTLMNKGLEMIEAHYLYGIPPSRIEVLVHPEQIFHSFVEFIDGSILAQACMPDMLIPIQYALTYPERKEGILPPFDFTRYQTLHFTAPNTDKFRCLKLAYGALKEGGTMPCFMNAANEILVSRFLKGEIPWLSISQKLETLMEKHSTEKLEGLNHLVKIDLEARELAQTA